MSDPQFLILQQQSRPEPQRETVGIPDRVKLAAALLDNFAFRLRESVVPLMVGGSEKIPPVKLEPSEDMARHAAADLLTDYLQGKMKLSDEEKQQMRGESTIIRVIVCPVCRGGVGACPICGGEGNIAVVPASRMKVLAKPT